MMMQEGQNNLEHDYEIKMSSTGDSHQRMWSGVEIR